MFKLFIFVTFLAVSNAYLSHGLTILNHPNHGPYHGGYSVRDHELGLHQNYLSSYRPHGLIPQYAKASIPIPAPVPAPVHVPVPDSVHAPIPVIQKLGHTGYAYAPAQHFPIPHVPVAVPSVHPHAHAPAGYAGHLSGAQATYVVAPSVSFSQNAAKQIAPAVPISKAIRIPYAFPTISAPHPIPHPIPESAHGW